MDLQIVRTGLEQAWTTVALATPRVLAALGILFVGWLVATLARRATGRVLAAIRFERVLRTAGLQRTPADSPYDPMGVVAGVAYWVVLLVTFQLAAEVLGAAALSAALASLVAYLPQVLIAVAIVLIALALGGFVAGVIRDNTSRGEVGAPVARWSIVGFGAFAALNQLGIAEPIVTALFYVTLATVGLTVVVAFGVGGIPTARRVLDKWAGRVDHDLAPPKAA